MASWMAAGWWRWGTAAGISCGYRVEGWFSREPWQCGMLYDLAWRSRQGPSHEPPLWEDEERTETTPKL